MMNYIKRFYDKEVWKQIELPSPFEEKYELRVSNYGNVEKKLLSTNIIVKMSPFLTEGYPAVNLGLMLPITVEDQNFFVPYRAEINALKSELIMLKKMPINSRNKKKLANSIVETEKLLKNKTLIYTKLYKKKEVKRRRTFNVLIQRWVASFFVEKPSEDHNLVAHIDYDKLNNHHSNLKWMTRAENTKHNFSNPSVIRAKAAVFEKPIRRANTKLTERDVMILKKRMNEGVVLSQLAKRYAVTETQLLRIKRGINWGKVPAAL